MRAGRAAFVEAATRSCPGGREKESRRASSSAPTLISSAVSSTLRASKPTTLMPYQCSFRGASGMQSRVGFRPTRPQLEAGMRIEPAPSEAVAAAQSPAATAAALPPLEPPGLRSVFHGLRVIPNAGPSVSPMITSSGQLVLPMITAPAPRSRRTSSLSCAAGVKFAAVPHPVTSPVTSSTSFTAIGTPSSGRSSPAPRRPSACWASTSARSSMTLRNAFS